MRPSAVIAVFVAASVASAEDPPPRAPLPSAAQPRWEFKIGVSDVAESPDGKLLAVACADGNVRLAPLPGGDVRTIAVSKFPVKKVVFSADGKLLVARPASIDPESSGYLRGEYVLRAYSVANGELVREIDVHPTNEDRNGILCTSGYVGDVIALAGDRFVLARAGTSSEVWDMRAGNRVETLPANRIGKGLDVVSDGAVTASFYGSVEVRPTRAEKPLWTCGVNELGSKDGEPSFYDARFSPDGKLLVVSGRTRRRGDASKTGGVADAFGTTIMVVEARDAKTGVVAWKVDFGEGLAASYLAVGADFVGTITVTGVRDEPKPHVLGVADGKELPTTMPAGVNAWRATRDGRGLWVATRDGLVTRVDVRPAPK
jgi:hypothetical protein